jgi:hypothetical protein
MVTCTVLPSNIHARGPAFGSESARLRGLRRAALAGAVRAPHCGRRRLILNRSHSGRVLADRRVLDHSRISPVSPAHRVAFLKQPAMASGRQHRKTMTGRWAPLLTPAARAASPNRCSPAPVPRPLLLCWVWTVSETGPARGCASAPLPLPNPGRRGRRAPR